ncbi:MAG: hypothetical protein WC790_03345 [Candidatus Paceibacterota bacterium]|jgi:hypothetical protein
MKAISSKTVAWSLGLAFALFITGLAGAFYTGRLAVVTTKSFTLSSTKPNGADIMLAQCTQTAYRTYGGETEIIVGQSVDLPYETNGGTVIQHADLRFGGAPTTRPFVQLWGNISHRGYASYMDVHGPNWVTSACMDRTRHTS